MKPDLSVPVIAIDGEAGTGKGTVRKKIAQKLGFHELDSGVLYRSLGYWSQKKGLKSEEEWAEAAKNIDVVIHGDKVFLNGEDVTKEIRSEEASKMASIVAKVPNVRMNLRIHQLSMRKPPGLVADGRDQCTIFDTPHRFFLKADPEEKARRRVKQLTEMGLPADFENVLTEIKRRDDSDRNRTAGRLEPHPEATIIDTTHINADQVTDIVLKKYESLKD